MIVSIIAIVAVLSVIVVIHEYGHLLAAKSLGISVPEFSVGMGPKLGAYRGKAG